MEPAKQPIRWLHRLGLDRPSPEESAEWEVEHHILELTDRLVSEGWNQDEARAEAERRFGDPAAYGRTMRRIERGRMTMERWHQWLGIVGEGASSALRTAKRSPGFTSAVVVTLALGIGANATMYGIVDRLLLRPPEHVVDHERVQSVFIQRLNPFTGGFVTTATMTYPDFADLKRHRAMKVAAFTESGERTIGSGETATRAYVSRATAGFFPLLGARPIAGRFYSSKEAAPGAPLTAVMSAEYWERVYGSDPAALGSTVEIAGQTYTIVGVAPRGFTGADLSRVDLWIPLEAVEALDGEDSCLDNRGCWWIRVVARLGDGVAPEAARSEATRLHLNGRRESIDEGRYSDRAQVVFMPLIVAQTAGTGDARRVTRWLAGVSLIVLLIACANVANLLMARGTSQRRETAIRLALGSGRGRVVGRVVAEAVTLALAGGFLAVVLARWGGEIVRSVLLPGVYFPNSGLTGRLLLFVVVLALLAGVAAGLGPALHGTRATLSALVEGGRRSERRSWGRGVLTAAQAAMSVTLLVGAGLFVRSLTELHSLDLGFDADRLLVAKIEFQRRDLGFQEQIALYEEAVRRVSALPGVQSASATGVPIPWGYSTYLAIPGRDSIPVLPGGGPYFYPVTPGYFTTLGLAIRRGRAIDGGDGAAARKVAVVSETMAATLWPGEDPLGRCLLFNRQEECTTVVGVAEDAAQSEFEEEPFMAYYLPAPQQSETALRGLYVRAKGEAGDLVAPVARLLRSFSPQVRYASVQTLEEILDPHARGWKLGATMFTVFGLLALALAAVGLYSLLAFDVAQRTRELGIRAALGAQRGRLLRAVLYQALLLGLLGTAVGLAVAYLAAPYMGDLLFRVSPRDGRVLVGVAALLAVVSTGAGLVPGLRATQVDPAEALRAE